MVIKISSVLSNTSAQMSGDWVDLPDPYAGARVKVRSINAPEYQVARNLAVGRLQRKYGKKDVPITEMSATLGALYAEHLLLDWDGFDEPFSREFAHELLTDPGAVNFVNAVAYCANVVGQAEIEYMDDVAKN